MTGSETELLSLDAAAERLGWDGARTGKRGGPSPRAERLRYLLDERERETGRAFMVRYGGTERTTLRVTMAAVKEAAPELFPGPRQNLAKRWTRMLRNLDDRVDGKIAPLQRRLDEHEHDIHVIKQALTMLDGALAQVSDRVAVSVSESEPAPGEPSAVRIQWGED